MTLAHTWRPASPVNGATPWIRTPEGMAARIATEHAIAGERPLAFLPTTGGGRHRVEVVAGTCAEPVPTERPDTIPDRLPTRPDACTWRDHDDGVHFATVRLSPDPAPGLDGAYADELEVCRCCAFETDHIYEAMRSQACSNGHVEVALRQPTGEWI